MLFRYLLKAREHDGSWLQRAFLSDERRLAAGLEKLVETGAIQLEVISQHERISVESTSAPASHQHRIAFVDDPQERLATPTSPVTRTDRFPLRATVKVRTCVGCRGTGRASCDECHGAGTARCRSCSSSPLADHICRVCHGTRLAPCSNCRSTGTVQHDHCRGEGEIVMWDEEVHSYSVLVQADVFLPDGAPAGAGKAVENWLKAHPESASGALAQCVEAALGYDTPELQSVVRRAEMRQASYEHAVRTQPGHCLFTRIAYRIVPISACFARTEVLSRQMRSWLIGRGAGAIEISPAKLMDPWKLTALPGLAVGTATGSEAWMLLHGSSWWLSEATVSVAVPALLSGVAMAGLASAGVGLRRVFAGRRRAVRTISVIACDGQPTLYLPCVAALGSYVGALEVLDRIWRCNLESLLGDAQSSRFSRTLGLRTSEGEIVRLVEVADPARLTADEVRRMTEATQGILFLETPEASQESLRSRIHAATIVRPTELRLMIDPHAEEAGEDGRTPSNRLALEVVRRAFTGERKGSFDWSGIFAELWGPISAFLSEREGPRPVGLRAVPAPRLARRARS